jgi:gluconolactonase
MRPFVIHDRRFGALVIGSSLLEKLWTGCRWAEGPAYFPAGRYLVWSDIPNDRMMRFDETDGSVSVFRQRRARPPGHRRTSRPAHYAHRAQRRDHGAGRPF